MKRSDIQRIFSRKKNKKGAAKQGVRRSLSRADRTSVYRLTSGRCHVCGDKLGLRWQADHVVSIRLGGESAAGNFLPICTECNRLRWSYSPKVLRLIIRMGVYAKHEIRQQTELGRRLVEMAAKRIGTTWHRRGVTRRRKAG
jgi:5-methylcytosine-specific restriction endonuclease McrA